MTHALFVLGTRPEAIKLCPVIRHMRENRADFKASVCVTGQHRELLDQVLQTFDVKPDWDLSVMTSGQTLSEVSSRIITGVDRVMREARPDMAVVQGDTTTTFCGALVAFYNNIPVAHVEAGLRTGDLGQPFPEEANRLLTGRLAALHFPATADAAANLRAEGVGEDRIVTTGNTGIDALLYVVAQLQNEAIEAPIQVDVPKGRKLLLVTAHRRESFGEGLSAICRALATVAERDDVQIVYPVHPNPNVQTAVDRYLRGRQNISLVPPLDYVSFIDLMRRAYLLVSDSGGVQEEAPCLGKPVLVLRTKTERHEAVESGTAKLVGTDEALIVSSIRTLVSNPAEYERMARISYVYGDGHASERIADAMARFL